VVLGYSETGGGIDHWDVWNPSRGNYVPSWSKTEHVRVIYGPTADGTGFYGLIDSQSGDGRPCLAQFDRDDLRTVRTACGMHINLDRTGQLSPDGKYLALHMTDVTDNPAVASVALATVFSTPKFDTVWSGPPPLMFAWEDATTVLAAPTGGGLVRYRLSDNTWENVTRPGLTAATTVTALLPRRYDPTA
jgi:hypothetical protein